MYKKMIVFLFFLTVLTLHTTALSSTDFGIDTKPIINLIPDEVKEYLPDGFMVGEDAVSAAESVNFSSLSVFFANLLKSRVKPFVKIFSTLLALVVACSVINAAKNSIADESMAKMICFITMLTVSVVSYGIIKEVWHSIEEFMKRMDVLISAMLPVMTLLYTLGGNVATAIVNSSGTAITLSIINTVCQYGLFPFLKIILGLSLTSSVGGFKGVEGLSKAVRTSYTVILSGIMTVFSIFLLFKTNLAIATDGVAARTVKFAGSFIPVVGSAIGESVRSIISGLSLIKSSSGFIGILIVIFITLPVLFEIITNKLCFDFVGGIAEMLGCEAEGKIMKEFSSILNFALALTVTVSILFVFELSVFINTSLALGGG